MVKTAERREYEKAYRLKNKDRLREQGKEWRRQNPEKWLNTRLKTKYGITKEEHNSLLLSQNFKCAICGSAEQKLFRIDHCHKSNKVRGILCHHCNSGIGMLKESIDILTNAITYINKHKGV